MAKMFYTLDEVCDKLGMSEDEVREMATSGQIQEFRDRDKLMFKVEQIDLLAGDEDTGEVHLDLEDTSGGSGLGLDLSGAGSSGIALESSEFGLSGTGTSPGLSSPASDSRDGTGISVFDTEHGSDDNEGTAAGFDEDLSLEAVGSGSGLLDLTRESDDTSLGAELLEEVYSADDNIEIPANASGLFEAAGTDLAGVDEVAATAGIASIPMVMETVEGGWSGLGIGMMIASLIALVAAGVIVVVGMFGGGATPQLATMYADKFWIATGGLAVILVVLAIIGMFIGKATE